MGIPALLLEEARIADQVVEFRAKRARVNYFDTLSAIVIVLLFLGLIISWRFGSWKPLIVPFLLLFLYIWNKLSEVVEESLSVIDRLGLQIRTKYASGRETTRFIERSALESVFLHEYFHRLEVHFALALMVRGRQNLQLVFHDIRPGFPFLKRVLAACNEAMNLQ